MIEKLRSSVNLIRPRFVILFCTFTLLLFCSAAISEAFRLPDTGQPKCYQGVSPWAEISCSGTGQDGAYNINPKSYSVIGSNSDMVQDNNTGLIWQRQDDGNNYNWYQAVGEVNSSYNPSGSSYMNICGELNLGGYSDWRLPSKKELITIVDYSIPYPGPTINSVFTGTKSSDYWSSTTRAYNPLSAWNVDFYNGYVRYYGKLQYSTFSEHPRNYRTGNKAIHELQMGIYSFMGKGSLNWTQNDQ